MSDLQAMLPMFYSEGVVKRKLPLERFVELTSTNPARIFGLHPKKGVLRVDSDADVVIWDPERTGTIRAADDRSKSDYSAYEGWQVQGWPVVTIPAVGCVRGYGDPGPARMRTASPGSSYGERSSPPRVKPHTMALSAMCAIMPM